MSEGAGVAPARVGLVLSGGGARGAYEAGVVCHLLERVLPQLPPGTELDVASGTSVGAIHAAYVMASAGAPPAERARRLAATWSEMRVADVVRLGVRDLVGVPLRALGWRRLVRRPPGDGEGDVVGGLVDVGPLEAIVAERIPWSALAANLRRGRALCVSCTDVSSGLGTVFLDGALADPGPWAFDPNARALRTTIGPVHVRASAAIPFLFPAVRVGERFYVDGGLRMNTPLSPVLRHGCNRVLVVAVKHERAPDAALPEFPVEAITQPAFLLGKVLDALLLDHLEVELRRLQVVNAVLARGQEAFGTGFLPKINVAVRAQRGVGYRHVEHAVVRPSEDLGGVAAAAYRGAGRGSLGALPALLTRLALRGVPDFEADLLSYLLFDRSFTNELLALGREDARRQEDALLALWS
ncbi:MAG: patatin-like phospholipase family protein [Deltaproteobacteria bacterium]|nr:patatin-like phospholipase family protein [Deltaproteobacteria bacterium]